MNFKSIVFIALTSMTVCLSGCGDNPGSWPQEKVEAKVVEGLSLSEIALSPSAEAGVFTGTGKNAEGETFTLKVTQNADTKKISWDAKGDRGTMEVGSFSLQ